MYSYIKTTNKEFWVKDKELHRDHFKPAIISNNNEQYFIYNRKYTKINDYLMNQELNINAGLMPNCKQNEPPLHFEQVWFVAYCSDQFLFYNL